MSSSNRTAAKGGKGSRTDNKSHKADKSDTGKGTEKQHASRDSTNSKSEDIKEKVRTLIEMSQRSEEEVCLALHESDNDVNLAMNMLLENIATGQWETTVKKKKSRQASAGSKQEKSGEDGGVTDDWNESNQQSGSGGAGGGGANLGGEKEKSSRHKSGGPFHLHGRHNNNRGWRGREKQDNERNLDDGGNSGGGGGRPDFHRRGRGQGGSTRGFGGGRGRGGGRAGGRYPPRSSRNNFTKQQPIDTWDSSNTWDNNTVATTNHNTSTENWDDFPGADEWTTEEYTGSLADTKVFTPSQPVTNLDNTSIAPIVDTSIVNQTVIDSAVINSSTSLSGQQQPQTQQLPSQVTGGTITGTLNAAQTQYLNQLTQQNSDNTLQQYGSTAGTGTAQTFHAQNPAVQQVYNPNQTVNQQQYTNTQQPQQQQQQQQQYGTTPANTYVNSYASVNSNYTGTTTDHQQNVQQPVRTKTQRARVPPPSKIPSSAVEMPGDLNSSNIGYLDVQFGAMDFMSDANSFDGSDTATKYGTNANLDGTTVPTSTTVGGNLDLNTTNQNPTLESYTTQKTNTPSSINSALSQNLASSESIPQTSDHLTGAYNTAPRSSTSGGPTAQSATPSGIDINKPNENLSYTQPSTYNSYSTKSNTYNASTYSGVQTTSNSYVSSQNANNYVNNSQSGTGYNNSNATNYQNSYSSASYPSNANTGNFPSISQGNSYPTTNQSYQAANSSYGTNSGLNNSTNYVNPTSQYNSYNTTSNHKLGGKDNTYDSTTNVTNVQTTASTTMNTNNNNNTTSNNATSSAQLSSLSQSGTMSGTTKSTTTLTAKNSNSVVSNIPPGVAPVMSTPYVMGQIPYFQQPLYSYEDVQMLQQRISHMTTPYYDMSYQTPTTMAAVRDGTLANVGYSISSDGRFTRGDNNASPVPSSTLSQQTSTLTPGHQAQPILAGTAQPYFFTPAFNTLAPNYQFGMYTQLPAATNAHGSTNSNQYPKPATYGSGYGSYDALSQTQDYSKSGYVGNNQGGQKGSGVNATTAGSTGNDLSAMYGKSHAALGKVNSYDKQGFHSGTPPPFTGALHGGQNAGLAPSGTGYAPQVYIPTMTPHQQQLSTHLMQQPLHQMDVRHQGRRMDSGNNSGQRSQASNQNKTGAKQPYQASYWNQA